MHYPEDTAETEEQLAQRSLAEVDAAVETLMKTVHDFQRREADSVQQGAAMTASLAIQRVLARVRQENEPVVVMEALAHGGAGFIKGFVATAQGSAYHHVCERLAFHVNRGEAR